MRVCEWWDTWCLARLSQHQVQNPSSQAGGAILQAKDTDRPKAFFTFTILCSPLSVTMPSKVIPPQTLFFSFCPPSPFPQSFFQLARS